MRSQLRWTLNDVRDKKNKVLSDTINMNREIIVPSGKMTIKKLLCILFIPIVTWFAGLSVSYAAPDDHYEQNDTRLSAWYPGYKWDATWLSSVNGPGIQSDLDWYRIDVASGNLKILIDLRFAHANGDIDVGLYDSFEVKLAFSDGTADDEFIDFTVPGPGTYYILVDGVNAGNSYDLWWDDLSDDNYEENDTLASAWHPGYNWEATWLSSISGKGIQADIDWYQIDIGPGGERVQIDLRFTHADGDIDMCLTNPAGTVLKCSQSTNDNEFIDHTVAGPGTYYIYVTHGDQGNTYDLKWSTECLDDIKCLITWYYNSILDRAPEQSGSDYWFAEINRIVALGMDIQEGFIALGKLFFNSDEYILKNNTVQEYVTDLYETFLHRAPDPGGLSYWLAELSGGLTRNMVLNNFVFSPEFEQYMEGEFGVSSVRPEFDLANDLYRGLLSRLPDDPGFNFWLGEMQNAQCNGAASVRSVTSQLGLLFIEGQEYANRNRSNSEFMEDLYDAILRRAADLSGYLFWFNLLDDASLSRAEMLEQFVNSAEFQSRVQAVIDAGCVS